MSRNSKSDKSGAKSPNISKSKEGIRIFILALLGQLATKAGMAGYNNATFRAGLEWVLSKTGEFLGGLGIQSLAEAFESSQVIVEALLKIGIPQNYQSFIKEVVDTSLKTLQVLHDSRPNKFLTQAEIEEAVTKAVDRSAVRKVTGAGATYEMALEDLLPGERELLRTRIAELSGDDAVKTELPKYLPHLTSAKILREFIIMDLAQVMDDLRQRFGKLVEKEKKKEEEPSGVAGVATAALKQLDAAVEAVENGLGLKAKPVDPAVAQANKDAEKKKDEERTARSKALGGSASKPPSFFGRLFGK